VRATAKGANSCSLTTVLETSRTFTAFLRAGRVGASNEHGSWQVAESWFIHSYYRTNYYKYQQGKFQSQFFLALFSTNSHKGRNKNKGEKGGQEDLQTISSHQLALCQAR